MCIRDSTYGIRELAGVRDDKEKTKKLYSSLFSIGIATNVIVLIALSLIHI